MAKTKASLRNQELLLCVTLFGILVVLCFSLALGESPVSSENDPNSISILNQAAPIVRKQILTAAMRVFEPSLEMKENVVFLLTPALLVQEAVSQDVIVTYPSE